MTDKLFHIWPHRRDANGIIVENSPAVQEFLNGINIEGLVASISYTNKAKLKKDIEAAITEWFRNKLPDIHSHISIRNIVSYHLTELIGNPDLSSPDQWKNSLRYAVEQVLLDAELNPSDFAKISDIWGEYYPSKSIRWSQESSNPSHFQTTSLIDKLVSLYETGSFSKSEIISNSYVQNPENSINKIQIGKLVKDFEKISGTYSQKIKTTTEINFIQFAQMLTVRREYMTTLQSLGQYIDGFSGATNFDLSDNDRTDIRPENDRYLEFVNRYLPTWLMNPHNLLINKELLIEGRLWKNEDPSIHYGFEDLWGKKILITKTSDWYKVRIHSAYLESIGVNYPIETKVQSQLDAATISPLIGKVLQWTDPAGINQEERVGYTADGLELIRLGENDLWYVKSILTKASAHSLGYDLFDEKITTGKFSDNVEFYTEYAESLMDYYGQDPLAEGQKQAVDERWEEYCNRPKSINPDQAIWEGYIDAEGKLMVTHTTIETADQIDPNLHSDLLDGSAFIALGMSPIDYYIATHNRDGIGLLDNAIYYQGKCTVNMYNYYMATLAKIPRSERSFGHIASFTDLASESLTRALKNPNIIENQDRFRQMYESMGVEFSSDAEVTAIHNTYLTAMRAYGTILGWGKEVIKMLNS
ncbi:MAG: hypothetical protein ACTSRK_10810 [Promethearchaeota archaeon]